MYFPNICQKCSNYCNEKTMNIYCEVRGDMAMAVVYRADPSTRAARDTFIFVLKYSKKIANAKQ